MVCPRCGTENTADRKFCLECGTALARLCPTCGAANDPRAKFCGECGTALTDQQPAPAAQTTAAPRTAERRLVSVLFADLVGFTSLSESRDAEDTRELLTRYFDMCAQLVTRYGGVVEKFIGDAVMAVWGTPVAKEDDAERAVRSALDIVAAITDLGDEVGATELKARAGVLTGEAAVTLGATGQGMVAGDLVNTASRIQSQAMPGTVLVGERTMRATDSAIVYEEAGSHELKGKSEPVPLYRAMRVIAARGGAMKTAGLEAPFTGRDRELRLIKELFHASAEEKRAHLVSVTGIAGIGKSRLEWEFEKYIDGLAETIHWHKGRCLSYGEGVTYWALAEMVRMRAGIVEAEDAVSALEKLRASVAQYISDAEERHWVEPRLAHLLGLGERGSHQREELFGSWRLYFERLAQQRPTVLMFEDMHWADAALLDFIEYLLDWSSSYPLYVVTLARPELADRRPNWGAGKRNFHSIHLEPLPPMAMADLLVGLVPGLPDELRERILGRTEGIPLYAVETVRMMLDRGLLAREGSSYRPREPIDAIEVPGTLHALIAARLDGLSPAERAVVQDAAVLGKTFANSALASLSGIPEPELEPLLGALTRKEVLSVQADPRSPERGQYGFLQDLMRHIAYETLSKHDRKAKHLSAAAYLQQRWGPEEDEVVEVIAAHLVEAYGAAPDAPDAGEIKAAARRTLVRAGEHAASLAASDVARRYYLQAAELTDDAAERAGMLERAGLMAWMNADLEDARRQYERAMSIFGDQGETHAAARVAARLAECDWRLGHLDQAIEEMEKAFGVLSTEDLDEDLGRIASQLARLHSFHGNPEQASEYIELALEAAESLGLPELLSESLNNKSLVLTQRGRYGEALALMKNALEVGLEHDLPRPALRAYANLSDMLSLMDRYEEALQTYRAGLVLAGRVGDQPQNLFLLSEITHPLLMLGEWDEALIFVTQIEGQIEAVALLSVIQSAVEINIARGDLADAERFASYGRRHAESRDLQERGISVLVDSELSRARGRADEAAAKLLPAWRDSLRGLGARHQLSKALFIESAISAVAAGDVGAVEELVAIIGSIPRGHLTTLLHAHAALVRAQLGVMKEAKAGIEAEFKAARSGYLEVGVPFWAGVTAFEYASWLNANAREADARPLLQEARDIFERLQAHAWLEKVGARVEAIGR